MGRLSWHHLLQRGLLQHQPHRRPRVHEQLLRESLRERSVDLPRETGQPVGPSIRVEYLSERSLTVQKEGLSRRPRSRNTEPRTIDLTLGSAGKMSTFDY